MIRNRQAIRFAILHCAVKSSMAAPDRKATPPVGNPGRGKTLFANVCAACHGKEGVGTDRAPALNDANKLAQFDDAWYQDTITKGRPAQGMPTWGTVLSPAQVADLLAYIDTWRPAPATPVPAETANPTLAATQNPTVAVTQAVP